MATIRFQVLGKPATQGSKRSMPIYGKGGKSMMKDGCILTRVVDDNPRLADWRQQVAAAALAAYDGPLLTGPLWLEAMFERPRPKGHFGTGRNADQLKDSAPQYPTGRPDTVKLTRAVEDALTGVLWRDDSQVCRHVLDKVYGERFCATVVVIDLETTDEIPRA